MSCDQNQLSGGFRENGREFLFLEESAAEVWVFLISMSVVQPLVKNPVAKLTNPIENIMEIVRFMIIPPMR